ncbi:MAG: response regulator transcription factor [Hyphomonadaceae bacterium]
MAKLMVASFKPIYDLCMNTKQLVFIVDDEPEICQLLERILDSEFRVLCAANSFEAFKLLELHSPDAILADVSLPGENGISLCKQMRARLVRSNVPILMISAFDEPEARILAFEAGADDFIAKPFRPDELRARLHSRLRRLRQQEPASGNVIIAGKLRLDLDRVEARVAADRVALGPVEFKILCLLARGLGQLRSRQEIEDFVWGENRPASRALDPHINALRKKLSGSELELRTVYGTGYSLQNSVHGA